MKKTDRDVWRTCTAFQTWNVQEISPLPSKNGPKRTSNLLLNKKRGFINPKNCFSLNIFPTSFPFMVVSWCYGWVQSPNEVIQKTPTLWYYLPWTEPWVEAAQGLQQAPTWTPYVQALWGHLVQYTDMPTEDNTHCCEALMTNFFCFILSQTGPQS